MTTNAKVFLFIRLCHLCDQAVAIFDQLGVPVEKKDIIDDDVDGTLWKVDSCCDKTNTSKSCIGI